MRYIRSIDLSPYNCVPRTLQFSSLCKYPMGNVYIDILAALPNRRRVYQNLIWTQKYYITYVKSFFQLRLTLLYTLTHSHIVVCRRFCHHRMRRTGNRTRNGSSSLRLFDWHSGQQEGYGQRKSFGFTGQQSRRVHRKGRRRCDLGCPTSFRLVLSVKEPYTRSTWYNGTELLI